MLRDEFGHEVEADGEDYDCPVPEHEPQRVIDLEDASVVWERDGR
jgi:hypothetical protein